MVKKKKKKQPHRIKKKTQKTKELDPGMKMT